jgi:hypothetical protein
MVFSSLATIALAASRVKGGNATNVPLLASPVRHTSPLCPIWLAPFRAQGAFSRDLQPFPKHSLSEKIAHGSISGIGIALFFL